MLQRPSLEQPKVVAAIVDSYRRQVLNRGKASDSHSKNSGREIWLAVNAHGVLNDGTNVKARVKLNPSLITVGIKFHLPFGRGH